MRRGSRSQPRAGQVGDEDVESSGQLVRLQSCRRWQQSQQVGCETKRVVVRKVEERVVKRVKVQ